MASDSSKPIILLIGGGGWHKPSRHEKLIKALQSAGLEVHCPEHPSMNQARRPTASLAEDSVGTNSLHGLGLKTRPGKGLSGGVSEMVYVTAFALPNGGSMAGKVKEMGHEALMPLAFDFADDMTVLCRDPKTQFIGGDEDIEEKALEKYLNSLVRWNGQCMYDSITNTAWSEIPVTYVYTTNDMTVLETGHCPNLTATGGLAEIINTLVE